MLPAEVTDAGVYAAEGTELLMDFAASDREAPDGDPEPLRRSESRVSGVFSSLRLPPAYVSVARTDVSGAGERRFRSDRLPPGEHVVRIDGPIRADVSFEGAAALREPGTGAATLSFPSPTEVSLTLNPDPPARETVTVPRTPSGVARALSVASAGHRTGTSERSRPDMRGRPPRIEFGDETEIHESVAARRPPDDVTLRLPADLRYLVPAASLAFYLGAEVTVEPEATPTISTPDRTVTLPRGRCFDRAVAEHLRRTFTLDCLVRTAGPYDADLIEARHLETLGLDAQALYDASVAERFGAYLDAPFDRVSDDLPEWHLSMYVAPEYDHVPTLAHLVSNVPNLFLPRTEPLDGKDRLARALDDFYRLPSGGGYEAASVDTVKPQLGPGRTHGWLADEIPIDVFKTVPDVYERAPNRAADGSHRPAAARQSAGGSNRPGDGAHPTEDSGRRADDAPLSVVTVLNDAGMSREYEEAARIYEDHTGRDVAVTVEKHLTVERLRAVFESRHDLVHYIGHCDADGLRCSDGHLATSDLRESNAEAFILNACGSFYEGLDLVRQGSTAGAVTFEKVLDKHAARVGTAFARLLVYGFSIERALALARRRVIVGTDYTVVGDGTHALTRSGADVPLAARLVEDEGSFTLTYEASSPRVAGGRYRPPAEVESGARLHGSAGEVSFDAEEVTSLLARIDLPVVYDGDIRWSEELADRLG